MDLDLPLNRLTCPNIEDISPCGCLYNIDDNSYEIICNTLLTMEQIRNTFKIIPGDADMSRIFLRLQATESFVPNNIFDGHRVVGNLELSGNYSFPNLVLPEIHPDAFHSSRNSTNGFRIYSCDLKQLKFKFLTGFNQLKFLSIWNCVNVHLSDLPSLTNLIYLQIIDCEGLNDWAVFPILTKGLDRLDLDKNNLSNNGTHKILEWILNKSPSNQTLRILKLSRNYLTRIPHQFIYFTRLEEIYLNHQNEPGFSSLETLSVSVSLRYLNLDSCNIKHIEPGAFQGIYLPKKQSILRFLLLNKLGNLYDTEIHLSNNSLTRFESTVFQTMLEKMMFSRTGKICLNDSKLA